MKSNIITLWIKYPDYKRLQISSISTALGSWISFIGMLVLLGEITSNGLQLGIIWAVSGLAPILFSLFSGVIVDKVNLRKLIYKMDSISSVLLLVYILIPNMNLTTSWFVFFLVRFFMGIFNAFSSVASQKVVKNIVSDEDLITANSVSYTLTSVIRLTGASLGGILISFVDMYAVWLIASGLYAFSAINIFLCKWEQEESVQSNKNFKEEFLIGIAMVKSNKLVSSVLLSALSLGIIIGTFNLMLQEYVVNVYGEPIFGISVLYCTEGLIAILMGYWIAEKKILLTNKRKYSLFYLLIGLGWLLFGFSENLIQGMICLMLFSIGATMIAPYERFTMQTNVPYELQGRVFSLWGTTTTVAIQLGALLTGIVWEIWGSSYVTLFSALIQIGLAALMYLTLLPKFNKNTKPLEQVPS